MAHLKLTKHAAQRIAQRALSMSEAELIVNFGTEIEDGYIFLERDCAALERELKNAAQQLRKLRGKRLVVAGENLVTAYHATKSTMHCLLKFGEERQMELCA